MALALAWAEQETGQPSQLTSATALWSLIAGKENKAASEARDEALNARVDVTEAANLPALTNLSALAVPAAVQRIYVNGVAAADGFGAAHWRRCSPNAAPAHGAGRQDAAGAWFEPDEIIIPPEIFGVRGDYVIGGSGTDDTVNMQKAATYCAAKGAILQLNDNRNYLITATITSAPFLISGSPAGTGRIVFKNMAGLVGFDMSSLGSISDQIIGAQSVVFVAEGANIQSAVKTPKISNHYYPLRTKIKFVGNTCTGANQDVDKYANATDYSAAFWFDVGDCVGCDISGNNFFGSYDLKTDPAPQFSDCALRLQASGTLLTARINRNNFSVTKTAVTVADRAFMSFENNDCIGNFDGLIWSGSTLLNEPKITNNNFNSQRYGIYIDGPDSIAFTNNTVRRHSAGWKGATHDWHGIHCANVADLKLTGNTVQPDESGGAYGGTMTAYHLDACGLGVVDKNFIGPGSDYGLLLNNCSGMIVEGNRTAQSAAGDTFIRLTGNTRTSFFGKAVYVSTFAGTKLSDDGSVSFTSNDVTQMLDLFGTKQGTTLTIAGGVVTATGSYHVIDTEGAAATDDLDTITPSTWITTGTRLVLRTSSSLRDVTLKDGTGNLQLTGDFTLSNPADFIGLEWVGGSLNYWREISRSDNLA